MVRKSTTGKNASHKREVAQIVPGPDALKMLAHPDRLRMLGLLRVNGPATATILARRLGLNSGATSYHLRKLAEHGFIAPDATRGNRRDRWWRSRHESTVFEPAGSTGDAYTAGMAMTQAVLSQHAQLMQQALGEYDELPEAWRKASNASDFIIPLTAGDAAALNEKIMALLWEAKAAAPVPGDPLPEGVRPHMVMLHAFPYPGQAGNNGDGA